MDIVVGTPGRLEELTKNENLLLSHCRFLVLDEADGLLQQGHGELINRLHSRAPKLTSDGKRLQMIVCSATLHSFDVKKMAVSLQINLLEVEIHSSKEENLGKPFLLHEKRSRDSANSLFYFTFRCYYFSQIEQVNYKKKYILKY